MAFGIVEPETIRRSTEVVCTREPVVAISVAELLPTDRHHLSRSRKRGIRDDIVAIYGHISDALDTRAVGTILSNDEDAIPEHRREGIAVRRQSAKAKRK